MLKRKWVRTSVVGNGLVLIIAAVNGTNEPQSTNVERSSLSDPVIRQLQAFDSSFAELSRMSPAVLAKVPKIGINPHVVKFVRDYNQENIEALEKIGERGKRYFPLMDSIFALYHLPAELKYLSAVESELKSSALSHVGAKGPWQLMSSTARDLSLRVDGHLDERTNYSKSTIAAAKYLRDLYHQFGDWLLVIAAYNSGPGKVLAAIKDARSHNFWALQNYLPAETRGHVKRYIAIHYYFEQKGSVTTLTKGETLVYRQSVSKFIAAEKLALVETRSDEVKQVFASR